MEIPNLLHRQSDPKIQLPFRIKEEEKPRQVIGCLLTLFFLLFFSFFSTSSTPPNLTAKYALFFFTCLLTIYCSFQTRDGPLMKPHPIFWRALHGLGLTYLVFISLLFLMPAKRGIWILHFIFPEMAGGPEKVFQIEPAENDLLNCSINFSTLYRQFTSIWFVAHLFGWAAKMVLLRNWKLCLRYSIAFELSELSLAWLIPEFPECWWDSIFLDAFGANLIGMAVGDLILKLFNSKKYEWNSGQLEENNFSEFWSAETNRWFSTQMVWVFALLCEINCFFVIHAFSMVPNHWLNVFRISSLCFLGLQAVPEWFLFSTGQVDRIGQNCWLIFLITIIESLLPFRFGKGGKNFKEDSNFLIPFDTWGPWVASSSLFLVWVCMFNYYRKKQKRIPDEFQIFRYLPFLPLLTLTRKWYF